VSALSDLIGVIVPGGAAAGVVLVVQAVASWRQGRTTREETVLQRWQRLTREAEDKAAVAENNEDFAEAVGDYWRQHSAGLEYVMRQHNLPIPARPPLPTKREVKRRAHDQKPRRRPSISETEESDYPE
jgi:hypothetical protein